METRKIKMNQKSKSQIEVLDTNELELPVEHPKSDKYRTDYEVMIVLQSPDRSSARNLKDPEFPVKDDDSANQHRLAIMRNKLNVEKFWLTCLNISAMVFSFIGLISFIVLCIVTNTYITNERNFCLSTTSATGNCITLHETWQNAVNAISVIELLINSFLLLTSAFGLVFVYRRTYDKITCLRNMYFISIVLSVLGLQVFWAVIFVYLYRRARKIKEYSDTFDDMRRN